MENNQLRISYCIVCMNRLDHLKKTLLLNLEDTRGDRNVEFVLLDYNSGDGMGEWVKQNLKKEMQFGRLIYFRTEEPPRKSIQGLWSELFLIEQSNFPEKVLSGWHSIPEEK